MLLRLMKIILKTWHKYLQIKKIKSKQMRSILVSIITLNLLCSLNANNMVLIITHAYNRPEFIDLQYRCFKSFLKDDYEFVVFNDAPPGQKHDEIVAVCKKWNIRCIPIPQEIHDHPQEEEFWKNQEGSEGTKRHVDGIQYSLDILGYDHDGIVAFFDSDLFLLKPFSISKIIEHHDIVAVMRGKFGGGDEIMHLWPGCTFLAMNRLPNKRTLDFKCGRINGHLVDTGGYTYHYLQNNKTVRLLSIGKFEMKEFYEYRYLPRKKRIKKYKSLDFGEQEISWLLKYPLVDVEFYHSNHFMHHGLSRFPNLNIKKTQAILEYFKSVLNDHETSK